MTQFLDDVAVLCFMALMLWAAVSDFRHFIIPNRVCIAVAALYPAYVLSPATASGEPVPWIGALLCAGVVLAIGILMFALKAMGGGDVKLMAVTTLWAGPPLIMGFAIVTAVAGALLALVTALMLCVSAVRAEAAGGLGLGALVSGLAQVRHVPLLKITVPYGVAIAIGGLWVGYRLLAG